MENILDEEFYQIQAAVQLKDPKLIIVGDGQFESVEQLITDLVLQVKIFGNHILQKGSLRNELSTIMRANDSFGQQNQKVDLQELFQTLEEGFDSSDNIVSSCEVLQLVDYKINVNSFLGIDKPQTFSDLQAINQMQEKCLQWLTISNRVKDKSIAILADINNQSFFDVLMVIEQRMTGNSQSNEKLTADIEELLEEFTNLKSRYATANESCTSAQSEVSELRRINSFLDLQVKKLKDQQEFAEGLEDIERLNVIIAEKDTELTKIQNYCSILQKNIEILGQSMYIQNEDLGKDPQQLINFVSYLIEYQNSKQNQVESKQVQTENYQTDHFVNIYEYIDELNRIVNSSPIDKLQYAQCLQRLALKIESVEQQQFVRPQGTSKKVASLFNIKDTIRQLREQDVVKKDNDQIIINRLRFLLSEVQTTLQDVFVRVDNKYIKLELEEAIKLITLSHEEPNVHQLDEITVLQRKLQRQNALQIEQDSNYKNLKDENEQLQQELEKLHHSLTFKQSEISQLKTRNKKALEDSRLDSVGQNHILDQTRLTFENELKDLQNFHNKENDVHADQMKSLHVKWDKYLDRMKSEGDRLQDTLVEKEKFLQEAHSIIKDQEKIINNQETSKQQLSITSQESIQILEHDNEQLNFHFKLKLSEIDDLNQIIQQLTSVNRDNYQQINGMKIKFETIASKLQESEVYTRENEHTVNSQRQVIDDLQDQLRNAQDKLDQLTKNQSDMKILLETQKLRYENTISQHLSTQNKQLSTIQDQKQTIELNSQDLVTQSKQLDKLAQQKRECNLALEQMNLSQLKLHQKIEELVQDQVRYYKFNENLENDIRSLQMQYDQQSNDLDLQLNKNQDMEEVLEQQQNNHDRTIMTLTQEIESLKDSIQSLELLNTQLQDNIDIKDIKMDQTQRRLNQQIQEIQLYEKRLDEVHSLKEKNKRYMESALSGGEELMRLKEQYQIMQQRYSEIDQEIKHQNKEHEQIKQNLKISQMKVKEYEQISLNSDRDSVQSYMSAKINLQEQLYKKQIEVDTLQKSYQKIVEQNEYLENQGSFEPSTKYQSEYRGGVYFFGNQNTPYEDLRFLKDKQGESDIQSAILQNDQSIQNGSQRALNIQSKQSGIQKHDDYKLNSIKKNLSQKMYMSAEKYRKR